MRKSLMTALVLVSLQISFFGAEANKIKVLIVDGFSNHDWKMTTALLRGILEPTGLFDVSVSTTPATRGAAGWEAWRPQFTNYDVVIQTYNDLNGGAMWPEEVKTAFESYVTNGGGFFDYHAGNNSFAMR